MEKNTFFKFIILVYGKIYFEMLKIKDPPHLARFTALGLTALLLTFNIMAIVFLIIAFTESNILDEYILGIEVDLLFNVLMLLLMLIFSLSLRKVTAECEKHYDQLKSAQDSKPIRLFADYYRYLVFGLFILSVVVVSVW